MGVGWGRVILFRTAAEQSQQDFRSMHPRLSIRHTPTHETLRKGCRQHLQCSNAEERQRLHSVCRKQARSLSLRLLLARDNAQPLSMHASACLSKMLLNGI